MTKKEDEKTGRASEIPEVVKRVHNLIVLDESGSMDSIYRAALSGVNETLQSIRNEKVKHPDQDHTVTLVTFDSERYNRIYDAVPAEHAKDITTKQYRPNACTPLYDAMGRSITDLKWHVNEGDIVLVTIITDGYENASRQYNRSSVQRLVEEMKTKGWVFTYIGANQDVESVAESLSINNHLEFEADDEGTDRMFSKLHKCRNAFMDKVSDDSFTNDSRLQDDFFNL